MMKYSVLACLVLLTGCASLDGGAKKGAELNDEALNVAEWTICYGASIGSIRRRFGDYERSQVWQQLCNPNDVFIPTGEVK